MRGASVLVIVVAAGAAVLGGCGGGNTTIIQNGPSTAPTSTSESTGSTSTEPGTTTTGARPSVAFASPTRNIVCRVLADAATCGILQFSYSPPPDATGCGPERWGHALSVGVAGRGAFICSNQPPAEPQQVQVLAYGDLLRAGPFRCGSSRIGLFCVNHTTHHGIALSRERARVF